MSRAWTGCATRLRVRVQLQLTARRPPLALQSTLSLEPCRSPHQPLLTSPGAHHLFLAELCKDNPRLHRPPFSKLPGEPWATSPWRMSKSEQHVRFQHILLIDKRLLCLLALQLLTDAWAFLLCSVRVPNELSLCLLRRAGIQGAFQDEGAGCHGCLPQVAWQE